MSGTETFDRKSRAEAHASRAGLPLAACNFTKGADGKWTYAVRQSGPDAVLLTSDDGDYGLVRRDEASATALHLANDEHVTVTVRDPTTDEVLETVVPETPVLHAPAELIKAFGMEPLVETGLVQATVPEGYGVNAKGEIVPIPGSNDTFRTALEKSWTTEPVKVAKPKPTAILEVDLTVEPTPQMPELPALPVGADHRYIICVEGDSFPQTNPEGWAREFARKIKKTVVIRDSTFAIVRIVDHTTKQAQRKAASAARPAKAPKQPRVAKTEPDGLRAKIIAACCREEGASPKDLNDLTKWKGAPWKWMLSNRKGTGIGDRYGYDVSSDKTAQGGTVYRMVKKQVTAIA